jgi:hypothetical protein
MLAFAKCFPSVDMFGFDTVFVSEVVAASSCRSSVAEIPIACPAADPD